MTPTYDLDLPNEGNKAEEKISRGKSERLLAL